MSKYQFVYQESKSQLTSLHASITKAEKYLDAKEFPLAGSNGVESTLLSKNFKMICVASVTQKKKTRDTCSAVALPFSVKEIISKANG